MRIVCQQTILMKRRALFVFFILWKSSKICNCRLLQIVCGTLWVNFLPIIVVCWLPLQNLEAATGPFKWPPFVSNGPLLKVELAIINIMQMGKY